jgi:hypothetical protein
MRQYFARNGSKIEMVLSGNGGLPFNMKSRKGGDGSPVEVEYKRFYTIGRIR